MAYVEATTPFAASRPSGARLRLALGSIAKKRAQRDVTSCELTVGTSSRLPERIKVSAVSMAPMSLSLPPSPLWSLLVYLLAQLAMHLDEHGEESSAPLPLLSLPLLLTE